MLTGALPMTSTLIYSRSLHWGIIVVIFVAETQQKCVRKSACEITANPRMERSIAAKNEEHLCACKDIKPVYPKENPP